MISEAAASRDDAVAQLLREILDELDSLQASLPDTLSGALGDVRLRINDREFGRLVRSVT